jgi:hypothetical protein
MNFDSNTLAVLGNTFDAIVGLQHVKTVGDLVKEAWAVAEQLETSDVRQDKPTLEQMREFCVTLAKCVSSYRQSVEDLAPANPYKRG